MTTAAFAGRRIFITGGAQGIGLACVERFVAKGARVGCFDKDAGRLRQLSQRFPEQQFTFFAGDVSSSEQVAAAIKGCAEAFLGIDGLVNCAGIDLYRRLENTTDEEWRQVFAVNLDGPMYVCRVGLPHLRAAGGGTIVNVSSGAGLLPIPHRSAYSASKAALQMMTKCLAIEAAEFGVRANVVCPGAVDTALFRSTLEASPDSPLSLEQARARYALARIAEPDEVAAAVEWLTGKEASYVTGIALAVDGGRTFH